MSSRLLTADLVNASARCFLCHLPARHSAGGHTSTSGGAGRDPVSVEDRHCLGRPTARTGLLIQHLPAVARVSDDPGGLTAKVTAASHPIASRWVTGTSH